MNPNEPSTGTEPGAAAGNARLPAEPTDQQVPSGPGHSSADGEAHEPVPGGERGGVPAGHEDRSAAPRAAEGSGPGAPGAEDAGTGTAGPEDAEWRPAQAEAHAGPPFAAEQRPLPHGGYGEHPGTAPTGHPVQHAGAHVTGTGPRFSPPEHAPRWATGPNEADRASYTFPPHVGGPGGPAGGPPDQFAAHHAGPGRPYGGPQGPGGPNGPGAPGAPGGPGGPPPFGDGPGFGPGGHGHPPYGAAAPGPAADGGKKRGGRVVTIAAVTALVTSLIVGPAAALGTAYLFPNGLGSPVSSLTGEQGSTPTEGAVGEVAESVLPSVVSIQTANGGGSGVVISSDGQILTNAHVVEASGGGPLEVLFNDGTSAPAEVLGADTVSDIAVIQAEGRNDLEPATLGDSEQVGVGADVVAIGSPLGLSGTVTTGVVSALNRPVNTGATENGNGQTSTVINAIQTDAAINPGNSGGPLVNMAGEVIGINTAIAGISQDSGSVGLGFAIPVNQARPIAEQLIEDGSASYPAIEATITNSRGGGAEVVEVVEGGAADEAGLSAGDVVVSVDGQAVTTPDQLIAEIRSRQPGEEVTFGVVSGGSGSPQDVAVTLGEQSSESVENEAEQGGGN
ncbi:trypsin-like peptidase domain-containing protein [Nocardiopsis sp. CA-288880]|uniref:S1C family serine protease n=1 Tax=Nocardiopsis sp. CA-288880 TaxID=3239995 RepID=UPI003D96ACF0